MLSHEWEEMHLTPSGWVRGSASYDNGEVVKRNVPTDAVQTVRRTAKIAGAGAPYKGTDAVKNLGSEERVRELRALYGEPTFAV